MRIVTVGALLFITQAKTLEGMVTLATVALCIGELQSLFFLYIYYRYTVKKIPPSHEVPEGSFQLLFDVIVICLPLCVNGFLTNIIGTLATLIVPRRLLVAGFNYTEALSLIGKYNGMAICIITIPMIVVSTINTLLIPDLSKTISQGKQYDASLRIKKVMKLAFLLGLATTIVCNIVPNSLGEIFFSRDDLGSYITQVGTLSDYRRRGLSGELLVEYVEYARYVGAYFASTVRLFRFSGLPVRFKRSEIIGEAAKLESQYFRCPGLQQPKPLQAGIHPI